jgi:hypothetical protein
MIKKRYHLVFSFLRPFFRLYNRLAKDARPVPDAGHPPDQPALIMANHVTDLDPFFPCHRLQAAHFLCGQRSYLPAWRNQFDYSLSGCANSDC